MSLSNCLKNISAKGEKAVSNQNRKARMLVIFMLACLFTVVASRGFNWYVATYFADIPTYVRNIYLGLILIPPFWAGLKVMDAWKKPKE